MKQKMAVRKGREKPVRSRAQILADMIASELYPPLSPAEELAELGLTAEELAAVDLDLRMLDDGVE